MCENIPRQGDAFLWTDECTKTEGSGRGKAQEDGTALPLPLPSSQDERRTPLGTRPALLLVIGGGDSRDGMGEGAGIDGAGVSPAMVRRKRGKLYTCVSG